MEWREGLPILLDVDTMLQGIGCTVFPHSIGTRNIGVVSLLADRERTHVDIVWCLTEEMSQYLLCPSGRCSGTKFSGGARRGVRSQCGKSYAVRVEALRADFNAIASL